MISCVWGRALLLMPSPPFKSSTGGILSIRECVHVSVHPKTLVNTVSQKKLKGISLSLVTYGFVHRCTD